MSGRTLWTKPAGVLMLVLAVAAGTAIALAAPGSKESPPPPAGSGKAKWFSDEYLNGANTLLSGTGITLDMYQDGVDFILGLRVEPPLGVHVTDDNAPPRTAAKKIVGVMVVSIDLLSAADGKPWASLTASNAEAAAAYHWAVWLLNLPADGLPVIFGDKVYKLQALTSPEGGDALSLLEDTAASAPPAQRPGVLNRRPHDHIGNFNSIGAAAKMLAGGGQQEATRKIVGVSIDADLGATPEGQGSISLNVAVRPQADAEPPPQGAANARPPCPQGILVDLVSDLNGGPCATLASGSSHGRPGRIIVWPSSLPPGGLPLHYGGQIYLLSAAADGALGLTAAP